MKKLFVLGLFILVAQFIINPSVVSAYGTTDQTARRITDEHVLFTISYNLGFLNRTTHTPLLATLNSDLQSAVGFTIKNQDDALVLARTGAIVLSSNAGLFDNRYLIEERNNADFTLFVLAVLPKSDSEYRLAVTNLPFTLINSENVSKPAEINQEGLADFVTPSVR